MPRNRRHPRKKLDLPAKANRILNLILVGFLLILLRVWQLSVIQHEERLELSRKPQTRLVIEPAKRGTIRDRFNIPLAINKVQYNAAIQYSEIRQIPSIAWERVDGKRVKRYKRRDYIEQLSQVLGEELALDPTRIEDLIHSKASFYNNLPFVIKEDISEKEYYRLKMMEKDWIGIAMQRLPKRYYPQGRVGADIIGYMGAISRDEYEGVIEEIQILETFLKQWESGEAVPLQDGFESEAEAKERLEDLIEHAYSINDYLGKTGIEGRFEDALRGFHGKKRYFSDARGNFLRELCNGTEPHSGQRLLLTISSELQEYAEKLLIRNEKIRKPRLSRVDSGVREKLENKHHWIKGGAVVALDPLSGEILALASYPRFDPNDYILSGNSESRKEKNRNIRRWFETESYVGEIWDQKRPLERECEGHEEQLTLTWENYLQFILPEDSPVIKGLERIKTVKGAVALQNQIDELLHLSGQSNAYALLNELYPEQPHRKRMRALAKETLEQTLLENVQQVNALKKQIDPILGSITHNYDKVLLVDLCRIGVDSDRFSENLLLHVGEQPIPFYRNATAAAINIEETVREMTKQLFHEITFAQWRQRHQKEFLKQKRLEEKEAGKKYARPYIDLLDAKEREMFEAFWSMYRWDFVLAFLTGYKGGESYLDDYLNHFIAWHHELDQGAHQEILWRPHYITIQKAINGLPPEVAQEYLVTMRRYRDLNRELLGKYRNVRKSNRKQFERHLAAAFYPVYGYGYGRSYAYRQAAAQGSIFKLVTSYAALMQRYHELNGAPYKVSQMNPLKMYDDIFEKGRSVYVGYDSRGKPIPQLYKGGRLPRSLRRGMGNLDIVRALELSSNPYFSLLAGDYLKSPEVLSNTARQFSYGRRTGIDLPYEISGRVPNDLSVNRNGLYAMAIGQHSMVVTPLQTAIMLGAIANGGKVVKPKIVRMVVGEKPRREVAVGELVVPVFSVMKREMEMPPVVREVLLEGMRRVVMRAQNLGIGSLSRLYSDYPDAISDYLDLKDDLLGKSSTAESMEPLDLDLAFGTNMYNHIWFGGICFNHEEEGETYLFRDQFGVPELVVVVYLRYGAWGKDAAPIAAQVAQKWRQINLEHEQTKTTL